METPLEHLQATTGGGLDFGFGALPPMANAQHAHGPNVAFNQPARSFGAGFWVLEIWIKHCTPAIHALAHDHCYLQTSQKIRPVGHSWGFRPNFLLDSHSTMYWAE